MAKPTEEEIERERARRQARREATPDTQRCINCGREISTLTDLESEHGLCEDCLMKEIETD